MAKDFVVVAMTFAEAEALERLVNTVIVDTVVAKQGERDAARRAIAKLENEVAVIRKQREHRQVVRDWRSRNG